VEKSTPTMSPSLDFHANGKELTVEGVDTRWV
jgi:hypothetical protein